MKQELQRLGFTDTDAETAVEAVGQASLPACLDWLCLHLPEEDLPPAFAPGQTFMHSLVLSAAYPLISPALDMLLSSLLLPAEHATL